MFELPGGGTASSTTDVSAGANGPSIMAPLAVQNFVVSISKRKVPPKKSGSPAPMRFLVKKTQSTAGIHSGEKLHISSFKGLLRTSNEGSPSGTLARTNDRMLHSSLAQLNPTNITGDVMRRKGAAAAGSKREYIIRTRRHFGSVVGKKEKP